MSIVSYEDRVTQAQINARVRVSLDMWARPHGLHVVMYDGAFDVLPIDRDAYGRQLGLTHIEVSRYLQGLDNHYIAGGC